MITLEDFKRATISQSLLQPGNNLWTFSYANTTILNNFSLTLSGDTSPININWGDGSIETIASGEVKSHTYIV